MADIGKDIARAKELLTRGELVAIPTETVYGLAGNALNADAVASIFTAKNRPSFDPLIVHVADYKDALNYVTEVPAQAEELAKTFWPGPLTLLLKKSERIPDLVTSGMDTVGIRCPDHALTRSLLSSLDFPLAAPSANPFGYVSPTRPQHVNEQLGDKIPYILDGGVCQIGLESTIVGFPNGKAMIYRLGGLSVEEIEYVIGPVDTMLHSSSNPQAPGQLKSHYAPAKAVIIGDIGENLKRYAHAGILSFQKDYQHPHQCILSPQGKMDEAAKNLFLCLRTLDKLPIDTILTEYVPNEGLGRAINDRLKRAAANE